MAIHAHAFIAQNIGGCACTSIASALPAKPSGALAAAGFIRCPLGDHAPCMERFMVAECISVALWARGAAIRQGPLAAVLPSVSVLAPLVSRASQPAAARTTIGVAIPHMNQCWMPCHATKRPCRSPFGWRELPLGMKCLHASVMRCADSLGPVRSAAHRLPFMVLSQNHAHAHHFKHFFLVDSLQLFADRQLEVAEVVRGPSPSIYAGAGSVHSMTLEPVVATAAMSTSSSNWM